MNNNPNKNKDITVKDLWEIFLDNIWIFVGSVSTALILAVVYVLVSAPIYQRTASVLMKEEEHGKTIQSQIADLGLINTKSNISNEIESFKRFDFMKEVVERLSLDYSYSVKNKLRWIDLYHQAPIVVEPKGMLRKNPISLTVELLSNEEINIKELIVNGEIVEISNPVPIGKDIILPTQDTLVINKGKFVEDLANNKGDEIKYTQSSPEAVAAAYSSAINAHLRAKDLTIIDISITSTHPQRAEDILNTLISVYNENWIKKKNEMVIGTSEFIQNRLALIEQELGEVDNEISTFKSKNLIPDASAQTSMQLAQMSEDRNKLLELNNQLSMAKYIQGCLINASNNNELLPANTGINSSAIDEQILAYNELLVQKKLYESGGSVKNPVVASMNKNIESQKELIKTSIKDLIETLNMQVSQISLQTSLQEQKLARNPEQAKQLLSSERRQLVKEQLYIFLLQKREENELSQAFVAYNIETICKAVGSSGPVYPSKARVLLYALLAGLALPIIYIFLRTAFDTRIKSKKDIESLTIPYLGGIPRISVAKESVAANENVVVSANGNNMTNEAFRIIRSNLDFINSTREGGAQVIQLISMNPGSGKSFITMNLGVAMALKDTKVLLIDADIRKATLSSRAEASKSGLSEYLSNKYDDARELIVHETLGANIDVLPVGKIPPNPSELLLKPKFAALLEQMRGEYDYIFVDCPPIDIVPDAAIIGKHCDSSIFIIRAGLLDKRQFPDIEAAYTSNKYNNMSLILNDVKYKGHGYYGYRKYGYYGYSYTNKK